MCYLLLACFWGTVSYRGVIAVFLLHRTRLCPLVYRVRAVSFFLVRRAKRARHACDVRPESFSRLAASLLHARASVHSPRKKRDCMPSNRFINKRFQALGKTSLTRERKIGQMLDTIHAKCPFLLLTLEDKRWLYLQNDHPSVPNEKAIKSCAVVIHQFSQWSQIGP